MSKAGFNTLTEPCETCDRRTPHDVTITQKTEGPDSEHPEFSGEPYRVSECSVCGETVEERMNGGAVGG